MSAAITNGMPALSYAPAIQSRGTRTESLQQSSGVSFSDRLRQAVSAVNSAQHEADDQLRAVASGRDFDLHTAMIALEEADISLRTMTSVRDKVVEAYERVMNLGIESSTLFRRTSSAAGQLARRLFSVMENQLLCLIMI